MPIASVSPALRGAGKSTITNKLAKLYRGENKRIGIIAVDPTSPFTGGALLGDRVRMTDVELDEGVLYPQYGVARKLGRTEQEGERGGRCS